MISKLATPPTHPGHGTVSDRATPPHGGLTEGAVETLRPVPEISSHRPNLAALWWLPVLAAAAAAWHYRQFWWPWVLTLIPLGAAPPSKSTARIIPVATALVRQCDMDLYLNGLGTVTANKTVTVRSRVEGELLKVHFTEGQMVDEGDVLAEIDPREFEVRRDQAEGQLARDEATLKLAKLTLERYQDLFKSNVVAQQQLDDQAALVQQTEGAIQTVRAMLANARLQLGYCRIVAPISGRIGLRLVDQGNYVRANDANGLAVITQLRPIAVVFTIPQDEIARVLKQQERRKSRDEGPLTVEVYDRDLRHKLDDGTLAAIDNQVDPATGTLRLKAVFENEDQLLFPNQFVNARLLVETKRGAIVVPSAAVQHGPSSMFVYVVRADEYVDLRNVVIGSTEGNETSIESGLAVDEIVVTDGIDKLQPWKDKEHPGTKVSMSDKEQVKEKEKKQPSGAVGSPNGASEQGDGGQKGAR